MEFLRDRMPKDQREADQVEKELAEELNKLSAEERELILLDIHGVSENHIDGDTVAAKLEEFQKELLLTKEKEAYERALHLDRAFVEDPSFQVLFLRCAGFNVKRAVDLVVSHFQTKAELFVRDDDDILVRNVTWNDLDEHDRLVVSSGVFQVGSKRDVAGRTILFFTPTAIQPSMRPESMIRAYWYFLMSALLSDREMQEKGVVIVWINLRSTIVSLSTLRRWIRVHNCLPLMNAAVHFGYQNPALHYAMVGVRLLLFANTARLSFRFRFHFGDLENISFELMTFGIPMDASPTRTPSRDGSTGVSIEWHLEWLRAIRKFECKRETGGGNEGHRQQTIETPSGSSANETICLIPRRFDVLFGKAKKCREHPGTLRCHHLVHEHRQAYEQASRRDKTRVTDHILSIIRDSGGRFLRWASDFSSDDGGYWIVVEHEVAREKVSHIFRKLRGLTNTAPSCVEDANGTASTVAPLMVPQIDALFAEERSRMSNHPESVQPQTKQRRI